MDRFDVIEGFYWFFTHAHGGQGCERYRRLCRLSEIYRPGPMSRGPDSYGGWLIYSDLMAEAGLEPDPDLCPE